MKKKRKCPCKQMRQSLGRQQKQDLIRHKLTQSTKFFFCLQINVINKVSNSVSELFIVSDGLQLQSKNNHIIEVNTNKMVTTNKHTSEFEHRVSIFCACTISTTFKYYSRSRLFTQLCCTRRNRTSQQRQGPAWFSGPVCKNKLDKR